MASALDGITVLDLGTGPAAALATMLLSDQGARVIRLIEPGAPVHRDGGFIIWDRGKSCTVVDLAKDRAAFDRLAAGVDVLIEDFAPASPHQDVVAYQRLARINPRLVSCSITAYGKHGPLKDEPPIEDLVLARSGVLGGMPGFRPPPVHVVHPLPTVGAALFAAIGIAASLLAREETGRGRTVETSLLAGALLYHPKVIGERLARHVFQTHPSGSAPFYSLYRCADGNWLQLGCVHLRFIGIAAELMGLGRMVADPRFNGGRGGTSAELDQELRDAIQRVIATKPAAQWSAEFEAADVPFAPARETKDGLGDPQVIHNQMVLTLLDPARGPVTQMGVPIVLTETPGRVQGPRAAAATPPPELPAPAHSGPSVAAKSGDLDPPPLAGVRILEITNLIAGPTGGRLLADLGADVIKLEPHEGDMSRPIGRTYFYNVNFNKRSISVDTRTATGKQVVQRIAACADALLANLRPKATERMGIVPANNPRLIETHLTGYGFSGPYSHRPGIDPLAQALMGLSRAQGGKDNPPVFPAQLAPTDYTTGAMGALGTILALYARKRHGTVQRVESNLLNGGAILSSAWFSAYAGRPERPLADKDQMGLSPFHRLYRVSGGWVYVVAQTEAAQLALRGLAGAPASAARMEPDRHPNEGGMAKAIAAALSERPLADVLASCKAAGIPAIEAQAGDSELFLADPHAIANDMVVTRRHPTAGDLTVAWNYIQFGGTRPSAGRPTPLLGEQTDEVLAEVGYSAAEVKALHDETIVKVERAPAQPS